MLLLGGIHQDDFNMLIAIEQRSKDEMIRRSDDYRLDARGLEPLNELCRKESLAHHVDPKARCFGLNDYYVLVLEIHLSRASHTMRPVWKNDGVNETQPDSSPPGDRQKLLDQCAANRFPVSVSQRGFVLAHLVVLVTSGQRSRSAAGSNLQS